ncbi:hypothetical protein CEXT_63971 [Caerostris extrusa]|uniref:Uncharacterized protein n=1 Tax=Caerostris extrusa TaxID=172846 RepID=A0AAV4TRP1_CAEEX|nr:hypothetical protein CEXT_63971 [Caerostris extrusa]
MVKSSEHRDLRMKADTEIKRSCHVYPSNEHVQKNQKRSILPFRRIVPEAEKIQSKKKFLLQKKMVPFTCNKGIHRNHYESETQFLMLSRTHIKRYHNDVTLLLEQGWTPSTRVVLLWSDLQSQRLL